MAEYRVSVDLATALSAARRRRQGGMAAAIEEELHASRSKRLEIAVWVSGPGYVGKIAADVPGSGLGTTSFLLSFTALHRDRAAGLAGRATGRARPQIRVGHRDRLVTRAECAAHGPSATGG